MAIEASSIKQVVVRLTEPNGSKVFVDEDVRWTNEDGYLRIFYGNDEVAQFQPAVWKWAELIDAPQSYTS